MNGAQEFDNFLKKSSNKEREHIYHQVCEKSGAEAFFAERTTFFAPKPPSRICRSGSHENN